MSITVTDPHALVGKLLEAEAAITRLQADLARAREAWPIATDGPHEISDARAWLARQLMDSKLDEEAALEIVAHHPSIRHIKQEG